MTTSAEIKEKVEEYLTGDYEISEIETIPSPEEVEFGKKAKKISLCTLSIDLRNSTSLLFKHQKQTAGKIHKSFLYAVTSVINNNGGFIRSFNGDSVLSFWPARTKDDIRNCVKAAMKIKWILNVELSDLFNNYESLDFGIGIDWGDVYIVRAGLPRNSNNNDLVFLGESVNFAVGICEQAKGPYHVEISTKTYNNLDDATIYGMSNGQKVNMWKDGVITWKSGTYNTKITSWYWAF